MRKSNGNGHFVIGCSTRNSVRIQMKISSNSYHVAIIGGGLGGLTLAAQLADAGYSCIVFEKNKYPFHKVCGEYVSRESWDFLERLGLRVSHWDLPRIKRLQVTSPNGNLLKNELDPGGFGISRFKLDHELYLLAKQKGACVLENCKVYDCRFENDVFEVKSDKGIYSAQICIGAWGKQSNMDNGLARNFTKAIKKKDKNYIGVKYHIYFPFPEDLIELHNFKDGYCGISRVEKEICCLCYLTTVENLKKYRGDIKKMETEILMKNPALRAYFERGQFLFEEPLTISQIRIGYKSAVENNVLMLGDAAGSIAPLSGNGMSMAMRSSAMLYTLLNQYFQEQINREKLAIRYETFWKKEFKKRVQLSKNLQRLLKNELLTNVTISILKRADFLRKRMIRATHGEPF
jgi:flavin-dependent dehydrogenase